MRLSNERIEALQCLMKQQFGLEYSTEQAQEAGLAIMRFVQAKIERNQELTNLRNQEKNDGYAHGIDPITRQSKR